MMLGISMATHITLLHASMVAHIQDPFSEFHSVMVRTRRLLWSVPIVAPRINFRAQYDDFMTTEASRWDRPRFQL